MLVRETLFLNFYFEFSVYGLDQRRFVLVVLVKRTYNKFYKKFTYFLHYYIG